MIFLNNEIKTDLLYVQPMIMNTAKLIVLKNVVLIDINTHIKISIDIPIISFLIS